MSHEVITFPGPFLEKVEMRMSETQRFGWLLSVSGNVEVTCKYNKRHEHFVDEHIPVEHEEMSRLRRELVERVIQGDEFSRWVLVNEIVQDHLVHEWHDPCLAEEL